MEKNKRVRFSIYLYIFVCSFAIIVGEVLENIIIIINSEYANDNSAQSSIVRLVQVVNEKVGLTTVYIVLVVFAFIGGMVAAGVVLRYVRLEDKYVFAILHGLAFGILFICYGKWDSLYLNMDVSFIDLSSANTFFLIVLEIIAIILITKNYDDLLSVIKKYTSRKYNCFSTLVFIYIAFACCGQKLFLSSETKPWEFGFVSVAVFLLFFYWLLPYEISVLRYFEWKNPVEYNEQIDRRRLIICGIVTIFVYLGYFAITFPGIVFPDPITAWPEVIGEKEMTNAFPAFVKVIWRPLAIVTGSIWPVTLLQIFLWLFTVYMVLGYMRKKGIGDKLFKLILILNISPPIALFVITPGSNFYYTIAFVLCVLLVLNDFEKKKGSLLFTVLFGLSLALLFLSRNEGRITYAYTIIILVLVGMFQKKRTWIVASLLSIIIVAVAWAGMLICAVSMI